MTIEEKKKQLCDELIKESERFSKSGFPTKDHECAILYLKYGIIKGNGDLITACIEDFDCIYSDYCE